MKSTLLLLAAGAAPLLAPPAEELDIRPGMWEISAVTQVNGAPPLSQDRLAKMTPRQRAEPGGAFRAEAASSPQSEVTRECITSQDVEQPFRAAALADCTQTTVRTTRTTQQARLVCSGERKAAGVFSVTAPNPEAMSATLELRTGDGPAAMIIRTQMKGRWLSDECEEEDAYDEQLDDQQDTFAPEEYDEPEDEP